MFNVRIERIVPADHGKPARDADGKLITEVIHHASVDGLFTDGPAVKVMRDTRDGVLLPSAIYSTGEILRLEVTD